MRFLIFILLILSCAKQSRQKEDIKWDNLKSWTIEKTKHEIYDPDILRSIPFEYSKAFIVDWNSKAFTGPTKYFPNYKLLLTFKNDSVRTFLLNCNSIKENTDNTKHLNQMNSSDSLWIKSYKY